MTITLADVEAAYARIRPFIYHSPCPDSDTLSQLCGAHIYVKMDHLQSTGAFKERGARNRLMLLDDSERQRGVIAASAGNHALGLAFHGRALNIPVTVVMPEWAPLVKTATCRRLGAEVILHGNDLHHARLHAMALAESTQRPFIPPFDDAAIIAGQGTIALEILEDVPDCDVIIVPVGGGGLISGVGTVIKALRPQVQIIGVEPERAPTLSAALAAGEPVDVEVLPTLADGLAVRRIGNLCFPICQRVVDRVVTVNEWAIARAVLRLLELEKAVVEGAGATSLAAAMAGNLHLAGKKVVLLLCGGNIDVTMISRIIERGLVADGRLCRLHLDISDRPGSLAPVLAILAAAGASVKEIHHDRHFGPTDVNQVLLTCVCETRDSAHIASLHQALRNAGVRFRPGLSAEGDSAETDPVPHL